MITAEQIRAARALLDWSTADLAKRIKLTVNGLNKIERGHVTAQRDTLLRIRKAFEENGIEFLPGCGLRKKDNMVTVFEGDDFRKEQISLWHKILKTTGGTLCIAHESEEEAIEDVGLDAVMDELEKRRQIGISHKILVRDDDTGLIPPYHTYHDLPEKYFSPYPLEVFGDHVSFSSRKFARKSIIIHNKEIADSIQKLFDFVYDNTEITARGKEELARQAVTNKKNKGDSK